MRPLEVLLVVLLGISTVALCSKRSTRRLLYILWILDVLALAAHALFEGVHWQMGPVYLGILLFPAVFWLRGIVARRWAGAGMVVLIAASCGMTAFLPMFRLPEPTGPYAIGTQVVHLVNAHPKDPSSAGADGKRELMVQVWYPAADSRAPRAEYRRLRETTPLSSYQAVLWTHARWNPPVASTRSGDAGGFPVLLLNPSWNGRRTNFMYLVEELVSQGYVAVGIDHTGNSGPTAFPDGHVSQPLDDPQMDFAAHSYAEVNAYGAQQVEIQTDDDRFVLDRITAWNQDPGSPYFHRLDLGKVGAFGHSFGGTVSAEACLEDARFKAALDLDGSFFGPVQRAGMTKPLMMIEEDYGVYTPEQLQHDHLAQVEHQFDLSDDAMMANSNGYRIILHGSTHPSYTDRSLYSSVKQYSGIGTITADREYSMIRSYAVAFFDKTLRGRDAPLLNGTNHPYPEATMGILRRP